MCLFAPWQQKLILCAFWIKASTGALFFSSTHWNWPAQLLSSQSTDCNSQQHYWDLKTKAVGRSRDHLIFQGWHSYFLSYFDPSEPPHLWGTPLCCPWFFSPFHPWFKDISHTSVFLLYFWFTYLCSCIRRCIPSPQLKRYLKWKNNSDYDKPISNIPMTASKTTKTQLAQIQQKWKGVALSYKSTEEKILLCHFGIA